MKTQIKVVSKHKRRIITYGDVMTVKDFHEACECHMFIDYDGSGYAGSLDEHGTLIAVAASCERWDVVSQSLLSSFC